MMKLVHDADNVAPLTIDGLSVADSLRKLADDIEADEFGDVRHALVLLDTPTQLFMESRGTAISRYETAGMISLAAQTVFDD